jgi:hypothetical protein
MSNLDLVNSTYKNIFGKDYTDTEGQNYWANQLDAGMDATTWLPKAMTNSAVNEYDYYQNTFDNLGLSSGNHSGSYRRDMNQTKDDLNAQMLSGEILPADLENILAKKGTENWGYQWHEGAGKYVPSNHSPGSSPGGISGGGTTTGNITIPSNSNPLAQGWSDQLSKGIPEYFSALEGYKNLPSQIDEWMQNSLNRQRMTGEQATNIFNRVGNQRAGSGIMGGTENQNMEANVMAELAKIFNDNQTNIEMNGNTMKAQAISGLPGQTMLPINAMTSVYGTNANDQLGWANLAANMLNVGY